MRCTTVAAQLITPTIQINIVIMTSYKIVGLSNTKQLNLRMEFLSMDLILQYLLLLVVYTTTGGHAQGLNVSVLSQPVLEPYPAATWIHLGCFVTGNTSKVTYNWTFLCGVHDPPLTVHTYLNHDKVGQFEISIRSTPSVCHDTVMCNASDLSGNTGYATWRIGRVTGAGLWGSRDLLYNTSALQASADGDFGIIHCHSTSTDSNVGRWISPLGLDITTNLIDPFSVQFYSGLGYPSYNTFKLQSPFTHPFNATYEGIYSCVVPDDQDIMQTLHIGIYSDQYSNNLTLELEHLGRFSESPLTLNCPTTGLPPINTYWIKGSEFLRNGRTYGITTVIRNRKTSTFNNFLRIKQTLQQAEGLYFFGAVNAMDGRVQNLQRGPNFTSVHLFIMMYSVGEPVSSTCSFDGASSYKYIDEEGNLVVRGQNITYFLNDSIHHKLYTCIGMTSDSSVVYYHHTKVVVNVPAESLYVTTESDDGAPVLGQSYSMDCVAYKTRSGLIDSPTLQWISPSRTLLYSRVDLQLEGPTNIGLSSELVAIFPTLRTSHAGTYTCQASLSSPALTSSIIKNASFGITVQIPTPTVTLTVLSSEPHVVGGTFSLQCEATVSHHVDTLVSVDFIWRIINGSLTGSSDSRVTISRTIAVGNLTYRSILTISDLRIAADSNMNYACQAAVRSDPALPFILNSTLVTSNTQLLIVLAIGVSVSVTPDQITVIDVPPFNSFTLTCAATAASNTSATMVFTWLKQTPGSESSTNVIHNGHSVVIITSGDTSTLTTSETQSGDYIYKCSARIGDGEASSDNAFVSVGGPVVPVAATNIESTVTSFSTVILAWTVPRVAYTPETYTVVYGTNQLNLDQRSDSVNGTSGTTHYSVELTQLQHSTQYYYQVESVNIAGLTQSDIADFEVQNASIIVSITSSDSFPSAGSNFTLTCSVAELVDYSGDTIVTWRGLHGENLTSGSEHTITRQDTSQRVDYSLQFSPLKVLHQGQYTCDVSIPTVGIYDSKSISMQVTRGKLEVRVQSSGTSQVGTPYHLACQIGNSLTPSIGPVVYEWTSTCSGECFILRQPGTATASTQYLKAVDSGTHTCTVTDSVGNQGSASVNVSVTGVGIYHSSNELLSNNSVVIASNGFLQGSFFCLSGRAEAAIGRWIVPNGNDFTNSETHAFEVTVGGDSNPGVVMISLSGPDSRFPAGYWDGVYTCEMPDETGAAQIIYLGIYLIFGSLPQPMIQSLTASSLGLYSHFTLNCSSSVSAATEVTWTKDSQSLNIDNRVYSSFQILREGTSSSYDNLLVVAISDVNEHSGQYGCTVRNSFGSSTQSATFLGIRVSEHGIFSLGSEVSVTCSSDFGVRSIDWLQDGRVISTNQSSYARLQIQSVTESDHGSQYTCMAIAPFGLQEHSITIQVEVDPDSALSVNLTSSAILPKEGSEFSLTCMARKSPHLLSTPTIDWYDSMGNRIVTGEGIRLGLLVESGDGTVVRSLTFVSLDPSHIMEYRCNATIRFLPPPYNISKGAVWNLVVQRQNEMPTLPPSTTHETGHTRQTEATIFLGTGIGTGAAIVLLFLFVVVVVIWWKKIKRLKQRQQEANDVIFSNAVAMRVIEQTYRSSEGASSRVPAATNFPPTNEFYLNSPNPYEHSDTYTYIDAEQTAFLLEPPYPPPQYVPSTLWSDKSTNAVYAEIQGECVKESYQPQDKNIFAAETKYQSPPSDQGKESNASEKPNSLVQEM